MTPRTVTLTIPAPDRWLATNDRGSWQGRSAGVKTWRESAALHARRAKVPPIRSPFQVSAVVHKTSRIAWDGDGIVPSLKACIDGCRDVGLIAEDSWQHMRKFGPIEPGLTGKPAYLVLTFTELDPETPYPPHPTQETA